MLEENLDLDGVDEICSSVENLPDIEFITDIAGSYSISAPLK
ncbi:MAG: hypothetical protein WC785_09435 [Tatlockia sp.]|jgi:hypothetical protein